MVGIRVNRLELDEMWSFVGKKQKRVQRNEILAKGDQYVFVGLAGSQKTRFLMEPTGTRRSSRVWPLYQIGPAIGFCSPFHPAISSCLCRSLNTFNATAGRS